MSRTVLVAGVGESLGTALARRFADAGDRVALLARRPDYVGDLAASLRADDADALAVTADVTDREAVADAIGTVRDRLGRLDVLFHNASATGGEFDDESFARPLRTRTLGGHNCAAEALPDLRATGGALVFTGSSFAHEGSARLPGWGAAAFATRGLARSLADRFGDVRVAYVAIDGALAPADGYVTADRIDPEHVAEVCRALVDRPPAVWSREITLDHAADSDAPAGAGSPTDPADTTDTGSGRE